MKTKTKTAKNKPAAKTDEGIHAASFRDPAGYVFEDQGVIYRRINQAGKADYDMLMASGLYDDLVKHGWLVAHSEVKAPRSGYKTIRPERIPFITYPYEWSFSQLKDAALLTLKIQRLALRHNMSLKDASAYNIQFLRGKPVFIDTLSFEPYVPGAPWVAYKQFCQHFLAPLSLASYDGVELLQLLRVYIDGIPLPLAASLLPRATHLRLGLLMHLHWHAKSQQKHAGDNVARKVAVSKQATLGIVSSLQKTVKKLRLKSTKTEWAEYYTFTNYSDKAFVAKKRLVQAFAAIAKPKQTIDLGANNGPFSRAVAEAGGLVVSADIDPLAVEHNYLEMKKQKEVRLLPLVLDLTNPGSDMGWAHSERDSFIKRTGDADLVMALALIHHLAISNNLPLERVAAYFCHMAPWLIIEFVPKQDSQVKKLLATRKDIFPQYELSGFEAAFSRHYTIKKKQLVPGSKRTLYLMKAKKT